MLEIELKLPSKVLIILSGNFIGILEMPEVRRKHFLKGIPGVATLSILAILCLKSVAVDFDQYRGYSALISDQLVNEAAVQLALQIFATPFHKMANL